MSDLIDKYSSMVEEQEPQSNDLISKYSTMVEEQPVINAEGGLDVSISRDSQPLVVQRDGVRKNQDGSHSTHLMKTEYSPETGWVSFPSLFQNDDGSWLDMSSNENWKDTLNEAKSRGEVYSFGDDKDTALKFGEGSWKNQLPEVEPEKRGFFGKIKDSFTGVNKRVDTTEELEAWGGMPELGSMSLKSLQAALATTTTSDKETIDIIQNLFPDTQARQDEKGNYIIKSGMDGKEYAFHPGFKLSDIPNAVLGVLEFTPAGKAKTVAGMAAKSAAVQGIKEGIQESSGGEFNEGEIALAGGLGGAGKVIEKGARGVKSAFTKAPSEAQQAVKAGEQAGIDVLTTDVIQPDTSIGKLARTVGQKVPVIGTAGQRATQQESRIQAIRNVISDYGADDVARASDDVMKDLLKENSLSIQKYAGLKDEVISRLNGSAVDTSKVSSAIDKAIVNFDELADTPAKANMNNLLTSYKEAFQGKSLQQVENLRKQLGEELKDESFASIKDSSERILRDVYKNVKESMGTYIKSNGERRDYTKWMVANAKLADGIQKGKITALRSALNKGKEEPEVIKSLLFSQKPSNIRLLYRKLSPKGRDRAKTAIIQEAMEKFTTPDGYISPEKFVRQLDQRLAKPMGVFFKGEEKVVMDGLVKAINITREGSAAALKPATGAELTAFATPALGMATGGTSGAVALPVGVALTARIYESKPVRNLLLALSKAEKGKEQIIINKLLPLIQSQKEKAE